jgi:hypothetical protein
MSNSSVLLWKRVVGNDVTLWSAYHTVWCKGSVCCVICSVNRCGLCGVLCDCNCCTLKFSQIKYSVYRFYTFCVAFQLFTWCSYPVAPIIIEHVIIVAATLKTAIERKLRSVNPLAPSDPYMGRTAQLTSRRCILNTYSTNICTEYLHTLYLKCE